MTRKRILIVDDEGQQDDASFVALAGYVRDGIKERIGRGRRPLTAGRPKG